MNTAAIASHLNVADSAIVEVQEWARVLWVRVKGLGARFVSKKVVNQMNVQYQMRDCAGDWIDINANRLQSLCKQVFMTFEGRYTSVEDVISKIPAGRVYYDTDWYASLRVKPDEKPAATKPVAEPTMVTSTGQVVDADDWDAIEGAM